MDKQEKMKIYDQYVEITLTNLFSLSKGKDTIILKDFNPKNEEHLFLLSCAFLARDVFQKKIHIVMPFWSLCKLNWTIRKAHPLIKKASSKEEAISCTELLNFERKSYREWLGAEATFADIYKEYFEGNFKNGKRN